MTASTLLAALIAASSATNGVITVGDTQPFDQVRLYQNPANGTVLTNQSSDGSIDTSSTALVITGSTAPTGLVFEPNLAVLRNVTSDIKLLVDTPVELTLTVNLAGALTEMTVEAGKTAVLTLGLIAGIPMIVGAFGFFPVATDGNGAVGGLLLIPTGAIESADAGSQRFAYDGTNTFEVYPNVYWPIWYAGLPEQLRRLAYQIALKVPDLADNQSVQLLIADTEITGIVSLSEINRLRLVVQESYRIAILSLGLTGDGNDAVSVVLDPAPAAGSTVMLTLTQNSLHYGWDQGEGSIAVPAGFFTDAPNVLAYSLSDNPAAIAPLSIRVNALAAEPVEEG